MISQALYLTSEAHADPTILNLLRTHCAEVHVVSAVAQATALIFPSSLPSSSSSCLLIVADIESGGLALAEYVAGLLNRASPEGRSSPAQPCVKIVLIDDVGDVNAARKALRLGVDEYLLPGDSLEKRLSTIRSLIVEASQRGSGDTAHDAGPQAHAAMGNGIHALHAQNDTAHSFDLSALDNVRLSQIEAAIIHCLSAHTGLPLSARAIVNQVMGRDLDEDKAASLIRPHISRLRSKVEPTPQMPQRLLTVRGKGYMFVC
ncbi:MAG: hypothetical protein KatS3mg053_3226 [Candidatus Roseilinea sp.]|nr:MAG: hypothetical protein KatS3mg053_3226 [Candidatus Roseilinea sp.]